MAEDLEEEVMQEELPLVEEETDDTAEPQEADAVEEDVQEDAEEGTEEESEEASDETPDEESAEAPTGLPSLVEYVSTITDETFENDEQRVEFLVQYAREADEALTAFADAVKGDPDIEAVLKPVIEGKKSFKAAIAQILTPEELADLIANDQEVGASAKERAESIAKKEQMMQAREKNLEASSKTIQEFMDESGLTEEDTSGLIRQAERIYTMLADGKITKEDLVALKKMRDYDKDMKKLEEEATARFEDGRVQARNEKIEAKRKKETPITPTVGGGGDMTPSEDEDDPFMAVVNYSQKSKQT